MSLVVEGKMFVEGKIKQSSLLIEEGRIIEVDGSFDDSSMVSVDDGFVVLPAGVDIHVHFREPGFPEKEDFLSGSISAACGGVGCVFDMPNTKPPAISVESLIEKRKSVGKKSIVDYGLYCGITNTNITKIPQLASYCQGFKIFLGSSTGGLLLGMDRLTQVFDAVGRTGLPILVHAEAEGFLQQYAMVEQSLEDHLRARPGVCEVSAINQVIAAAEEAPDAHVHICHLSSEEGLETLRRRPENISVGVTPHHLLLDLYHEFEVQTFGKVNPPLRLPNDRKRLWEAVVKGKVDVIESDHAPHALSEKEVGFPEAPSGMPGVETLYPMILAKVAEGDIPLERAIEVVCSRPAEILGVKKGVLDVGYDADFIVLSLDHTSEICSKHLHSACGWSAFEKMSAVVPKDVFIGGRQVIEQGGVVAKSGSGRYMGE